MKQLQVSLQAAAYALVAGLVPSIFIPISHIEAALSDLPDGGELHGDRYLPRATGNGVEERGFLFPSLFDMANYERDVRFYYYDGPYPNMVEVFTDKESLNNTSFDPSRRTVIVIHGFINNIHSEMFSDMVPKLLALRTVNVIGVDWSPLSWLPVMMYPLAATHVGGAGKRVALMVDAVRALGGKNVHLIGHSLGAHVSGTAGKNVRGPRISRISGLDPAGPAFAQRSSTRLSRDDADLVDVIHTGDGMFGLGESLGDIDFYPNGGALMPGCGDTGPTSLGGLAAMTGQQFNLAIIPPVCDHFRVYKYYAESIAQPNAFRAYYCPVAATAMLGICPPSEETAIMGYHLKFKAYDGNASSWIIPTGVLIWGFLMLLILILRVPRMKDNF